MPSRDLARDIALETVKELTKNEISPPETHDALPVQELIGAAIDASPYRYEITRLLLLGYSYEEIQLLSSSLFDFRPSVREVEAFHRLHFHKYKEQISQMLEVEADALKERVLEEQRREGLLAPVFREADRLVEMLREIDARIEMLKENDVTPSMEQALLGWFRLKKDVFARLSTLTGEAGVYALARRLIERVARLALNTFVPALPSGSREALFERFVNEVDKISLELRGVLSEQREGS